MTSTLELDKPFKLSAEDLREAIRLGTRNASSSANCGKLAMKAKQVTERDCRRAFRPGPRLVYSRPMPTKSKNFTVRDTAHIDGGAYRWIELPDGSARVEEWRGGKWVPGGATFGEFLDNPPVGPAFAAELGIPPSDLVVDNT
jgi:hypothetical protein